MKSIIWKVILAILVIIVLVSAYFLYEPIHFVATSHSGIKIQCERGTISVPEVRGKPDSRTITIKYIRLKSFAEQPKVPIFYLAGGPGQGCLHQAEHPFYLENWSSYLKERDVVLINQRGVRKWYMYWIPFRLPPQDLFVSGEAATQHLITMAQKAGEDYQRKGIDLNGYNNIESAHDIDDLRQHLGYGKIILFGFSYGTHLGQAYIKYHEAQVDKAVLIGVEGLNHTFKIPTDLDRQFDKIAALVEQDSSINQQIPDLKSLYLTVSQQLEKQPITLRIQTPIKIATTVQVGKFGLDYILRRDMGDASDIPVFPKLLYSIHQGDYSILKRFVEKRYKEFLVIPAMHLSMDMTSGGTEERMKQVAAAEQQSLFGIAANLPINVLRNVWPVKDLKEDFRKPLQSDVSTLFLSGDLDSNTPAYQAEEVSKGFPNSTHLIVKNAGHEQTQWHWDMTKTILSFLDGADVSKVKMAYPTIQFHSL